jgi:hypothetical protein
VRWPAMESDRFLKPSGVAIVAGQAVALKLALG